MRAGKLVAVFMAALAVGLAQIIALAAAPTDPLFPVQWALEGAPTSSINAPQAWCASLGGVLVADVDTGADFSHPDLAGKLIPGARFLGGGGVATGSGQAAVQDDQGHGTMTTGIMTADTNNGAGIAGVAPAARALIVKVLDGNGQGYGADVAAGIDYASTYPGVRVINLSIGSDVTLLGTVLGNGNNPILPAITRAWQRGVLVAAAAGNNNLSSSDYASIEGQSLVVGALNRAGRRASYSSAGNVYAPGGDAGGGTPTTGVSITSSVWPTGYAAGDGTSFAAPQVAGTAALLIAKGYSFDAARSQVLGTAVNRNGMKELDAAAALGVPDNGPMCPPVASGGGPGGPPPVGAVTTRPRPRPATIQAPAAAPAPPPPAPSPSPSPSPSPVPTPSPAPPAGPPDPVSPSPIAQLSSPGGVRRRRRGARPSGPGHAGRRSRGRLRRDGTAEVQGGQDLANPRA